MEQDPESVHPVTRQITAGGATPLAVDAFDARYQLAEYKRQADALLASVDLMLTPTTVTHPTKAEVAADPIGVNARLGTWTNFMNLLDYSALAVPVGFTDGGLPVGVTLFGRCFDDLRLLSLARAMEAALALPLGATGLARPRTKPMAPGSDGYLEVVVCGAHLEGLPLNGQLTQRGGVLVERTTTAARYRLYALAGGPPARPALVRDATNGSAIDVEVWRLPHQWIGSFLAGIPSPLGLGQVELVNGEWKTGFICAAGGLYEAGPARDITTYGGWRQWLARERRLATS
jgi:allophanate hydrolase